MKSQVIYSQKASTSEALDDIKSQLNDIIPSLLIVFTATCFNTVEIAKGIHDMFPAVPSIGATTSGEIINELMLTNSLVVMALGDELIEDVHIALAENISTDKYAVDKAFTKLEKESGIALKTLNIDTYAGFTLLDGLSLAEEQVLERTSILTDIVFAGGSAGDDFKMVSTTVFANGVCHNNGAAFALFKPKTKFVYLKTQSLIPTGKKLIPTKVDEKKRLVFEFNHRPAVEVYAESLGLPVHGIQEQFNFNPIGLIVNKEPYTRTPKSIEQENALSFFCAVTPGIEFEILQFENIPNQTKIDFDAKVKQLGSVSAVIYFNCMSRQLELIKEKQCEEHGRIFKNVPTIGFSTYGEALVAYMNQTGIMLLLA